MLKLDDRLEMNINNIINESQISKFEDESLIDMQPGTQRNYNNKPSEVEFVRPANQNETYKVTDTITDLRLMLGNQKRSIGGKNEVIQPVGDIVKKKLSGNKKKLPIPSGPKPKEYGYSLIKHALKSTADKSSTYQKRVKSQGVRGFSKTADKGLKEKSIQTKTALKASSKPKTEKKQQKSNSVSSAAVKEKQPSTVLTIRETKVTKEKKEKKVVKTIALSVGKKTNSCLLTRSWQNECESF